MWKYWADVLEFHEVLGFPVGDLSAPAIGPTAKLRTALINEEVGEAVKAIRSFDVLGTVGELCDVLYVTIGAAITMGIPLVRMVPRLPGWDGANMRLTSVFWDSEQFEDLLLGAGRAACDAIEAHDLGASAATLTGLACVVGATAYAWDIPLRPFWREVHRANMDKRGGGLREDGKQLKPPGWRKADHTPILATLGVLV